MHNGTTNRTGIVVTVFLSAVLVMPGPAVAMECGDFNSNARVELGDTMLHLRSVVGLTALDCPDGATTCWDLNRDGGCNDADTLCIRLREPDCPLEDLNGDRVCDENDCLARLSALEARVDELEGTFGPLGSDVGGLIGLPGRVDADVSRLDAENEATRGRLDTIELILDLDPDGDKRVFVTSSSHVGGELEGITRADQICQSAATSGRLPGTYRAWIGTIADPAFGDRNQGPANRFLPAPGSRYITVGPDSITTVRSIVADVADARFLQTLQNPIDVDEFGFNVPHGELVWTGVDVNGSPTTNATCGNWQDLVSAGTIGVVGQTGASWTQREVRTSCTERMRVYCFQQ